MILVIGEILFDRIDAHKRLGGASFNFACHLHRMGFAVRLVTRVGDDADGRDIIERLAGRLFDRSDVQIDPAHPTGAVTVALNSQGIPQFDIQQDVAWDYLDLSSVCLDGLPVPALVYYGTLVQRTPRVFLQVQDFLSRIPPGAVRFCDLNLRSPFVDAATVEASLRHADVLKLNMDELAHIGDRWRTPSHEAERLRWVMETFRIGTVALTRGAQGSTVATPERVLNAPPVQVPAMVDTVGAGDAYAAVLAAGMLKKLPLSRTMTLAARLAARICGIPGAIPEDPAIYPNLE